MQFPAIWCIFYPKINFFTYILSMKGASCAPHAPLDPRLVAARRWMRFLTNMCLYSWFGVGPARYVAVMSERGHRSHASLHLPTWGGGGIWPPPHFSYPLTQHHGVARVSHIYHFERSAEYNVDPNYPTVRPPRYPRRVAQEKWFGQSGQGYTSSMVKCMN